MSIFKSKIKYYDVEDLIENYPSLYYMLLSGRNLGKSTSVAKYCVKKSYQNYLKFAYIRRQKGRVSDVKKYFNSEILSSYYKELTGGEFSEIEVKSDEIYFIGYDENFNKIKGPTLGYVFYLSDVKTGKYKSLQFDGVFKVIFEEFIVENDSVYLPNEVSDFENLLSTILRKRIFEKECEIFLIGNKVNQICPYFSEYGIKNISKIEPGEKKQFEFTRFNDVYDTEDTFILTVDMISPLQKGSISISKKGKKAETGEEWVTSEYPHLLKGENWRDFDCVYEFVFSFMGFYFMCRCLTEDNQNLFLFICPQKENIKDGTRVIGDLVSKSILYTHDFIPLVNREKIIFNLIDQRKIYFSDDATGQNFYNALKALKRS